MTSQNTTEQPTGDRAGARAPDRESPGHPRLWRWVGRLLLIVCIVGPAGAGWLWFQRLLDGPVAPGNVEATIVVLRGTPYQTIVEQLRAAGFLPHPFVFDYLAWRRGDGGRFKPGRYQLCSSMSARQIYGLMLHGAPIRVTVPEYMTLRQIASRLADEGLLAQADQFTSAAADSDFLARHRIAGASAEGYVLPETYFFPPGVGAGEILEKMVSSFEQHYAAETAKPGPQSLSWHQIVTLASMIEREARNDAEKPLIASVYYNRLRRGMTLDCDATVRFALSKWHEPLTRADLKTDSPYNTYLYKGLPPGPISCVGQKSLESALSPQASEFLYYCYRGDQTHEFSKTLAEHERAVEKFLRKGLTGKPQEK